MIDRDQLTEALATWRHDEEAQDVIADAARLLLDFPTDEQVEAAARGWAGAENQPYLPMQTHYRFMARAALEAVRQVVFDG